MRRPTRMLGWSMTLATITLLLTAGVLLFSAPRMAPAPRPVPNHAFPSAPSPAAEAVVWALGDGADGGERAIALARRIAADRPERVLYLGDVYERGSPEDFRDRYDTVYGQLARLTAPTPGNHEWPAHLEGYDPYWKAKTGASTPPWYAFRIGSWKVLSLNSEAPHGRDSRQLRWLDAELRRTRGTCILAYWHRPRQSAGRHGDQADVTPLWEALRGRATLVLNGHDHDLQRLRERDGITQLVVGAGGKSRYELNADPRVLFGDGQRDGALRMQLRSGSADLTFVATDGTVLDSSSVKCVRATQGQSGALGAAGP